MDKLNGFAPRMLKLKNRVMTLLLVESSKFRICVHV